MTDLQIEPQPTVEDRLEPAASPLGAGAMIVFEGVTKVYRTGDVEVAALRGIDLAVREGEYVAIMGQSGSGKTTLLGILGFLSVVSLGLVKLLRRRRDLQGAAAVGVEA